MLNLLRRNLYFPPPSVKAKAYLATVRPILEYGSVCWSPSSAKLAHKVEMVQHNAAKFVTNRYPKNGDYDNFSISSLIDSLGWESLVMAHKILSNSVIIRPDTLPLKNTSRPGRTCTYSRVGPEFQLDEPFSRVSAFENTFLYKVPKLWNSQVTP